MSHISNLNKTYGEYTQEPQSYEEEYSSSDFENYGQEFEGNWDSGNYGEDVFISGETEWMGGSGNGAAYGPSVEDMEAQLKAMKQQVLADPTLSDAARKSLLNEVNDALQQVGFAQGLTGKQRENILMALEITLPQIERDLQSQPALSGMSNDIDLLISKIESTEFPPEKQALRDQWLESLGKTKSGLELGSDPALMESNRGLVENIGEEFENLRMELESWSGPDASGPESKKVQDAAAQAGLSADELKNLSLPASPEMHQKLLEAAKNLDPQLRNLLEANPNPYRDDVTFRLNAALGQMFSDPTSLTPTSLKRLVDDAVPVSWPGKDKIAKYLSGDDYKKHVQDMMSGNNEANGIEAAIQSGNWDNFMATYINCGDGLDWNKGHAGSTLRRYFGALFKAADGNLDYFKRMIKASIPENVILEISAQIERNDHEKLPGDLLDSTTLVAYLNDCVGEASGSAPAPAPAA